jgi:hypothetical protein
VKNFNVTKAVSQTASKPATIGGLNRRDPIANMPVGDAYILENWFPREISVETRRGCLNFTTDITGNVETIMNYEDGTVRELFAIANNSVYDASSMGAVGSALKTGLVNSQFIFTQTENSAGNRYLIGVNGAATPIIYDGTTWGDATFSGAGLTPANLDYIIVYKNRLFFIEKNSFNIWYGATYAIGGTLTRFSLNAIVTDGAKLVGCATMTVDNTAGIDEYIAFFTDSGQVIMYTGTNPADAASWAVNAIFKISRPIGKRFIAKINGDPAILTSDGVYMLSQSLLTDRMQSNQGFSSKINKLIKEDFAVYGNNYGWDILYNPDAEKLFINIPQQQNTLSYQYVMNTKTGAWTKFTGWQANCFMVRDKITYVGGVSKTMQVDVGYSDNGEAITCKSLEAFDDFGFKTVSKDFKQIRPILKSNKSIVPAVSVNTDYIVKDAQGLISYGIGDGAVWDVGVWDVSRWEDEIKIFLSWKSVNGRGFVGALNMKVSVLNSSIEWQSTDYLFEVGGVG